MVESGRKFGKYTLVDKLAVGGMAEIFKARVRAANGGDRIVAIKRLHGQYNENDDVVAMLIDEAELAVRLNHPNIGEVFELGCIDGQYFIVMEYIEGLDLKQLLKAHSQGLSERLLVHVASHTAEALHHAHTRRGSDGKPLEVVHRDVSPQNIMLDVDGAVKLVDFGIAKARERLQETRAGIIKGKFYYMSPEQALDHRLDARSDVFALGMVLYEALAGAHPFDGLSREELLGAVQRAKFPPLSQACPGVSDGLAAIVDRAVQRDRTRRFETARQLQRQLEEYARRSLPAFERTDLARVVRRHVDSRRLDNSEEPMASGQFTASEHSIISEQDPADSPPPHQPEADDFDEGTQTRVFERGRREQTARIDNPAGPRAPVETTAPRVETRGAKIRRLLGKFVPRETAHRRLAVGTAGVVAVALAAAVSWWLIAGVFGDDADSHPDSASLDEAVVETTAPMLASLPEDATVFVDGEERGTTPLRLQQLETGREYEVRLERDGYRPEQFRLQADPSPPRRLVRLTPRLATVRVSTDPEGATVYLEDQRRGTAPLTLVGLDPDHSFQLEAKNDDEQRVQMRLEWSSDDEYHRQVALEFDDESDGEHDEPHSAGSRGSTGSTQAGTQPAGDTAGGSPGTESSSAPEQPEDGPEQTDDESGADPSELDIWELGGD